jgi:hypothetical protein
MCNASNGRAMYRSLFADLMESTFGISMSPLRFNPSPGSAGDMHCSPTRKRSGDCRITVEIEQSADSFG